MDMFNRGENHQIVDFLPLFLVPQNTGSVEDILQSPYVLQNIHKNKLYIDKIMHKSYNHICNDILT